MTALIFFLIALGLLVCLIDLRMGVYATLLAGFLQDPARKLVADEPVYFTAVVLLFAAATFVGAFVRGIITTFGSIPNWTSQLKWPIEVFVGIVVLQSVAAYVYTGSPVLAGIGLLVYLSPFPAFLLAYNFASSYDRVIAFLRLYVLASAAAAAGVYLTWLGFDWGVLQSVGEPLIVYSLETGQPLVLPSGFMRAPEVMAWHAASGLCVAVILGTVDRRPSTIFLSGALCAFFMGAILLTGRRKFLLEILAFLPIFLLMLWRFNVASTGLIRAMFVAVSIGVAMALVGLLTDDTVSKLSEASLRRDEPIVTEVFNRFMNLTFGSFEYVIEVNGFFGSGAGSGSQGAQHFGGGEIVGLAAEGGLGKILAEIGVPGLLAFVWLGVRFSVYLWNSLRLLREGDSRVALLTLGLAAFLAANGIVFVSAHQVFGDLFVLLLIGICLGFIVGARRFGVTRNTPVPGVAIAGDAVHPAGVRTRLRPSR